MPDAIVAELQAWNDEVRHWVRAHRERGLDIRTLDDHGLRMACYAELNRQLDEETSSITKEVCGR